MKPTSTPQILLISWFLLLTLASVFALIMAIRALILSSPTTAPESLRGLIVKVNSLHGKHNQNSVLFQLESGKRIKLNINESELAHIQAGSTGIAVREGHHLLHFIPMR
jgi:hypothetical protein